MNVLDKNGDHPLYEALRHHTVSQIKQLQDSNRPGSEKVTLHYINILPVCKLTFERWPEPLSENYNVCMDISKIV